MRWQQGFTLIELLIVVAIIGILANTILPALQDARDRSLDTKRIAEVDSVRKALEKYFLDYDEYPNDGVTDDEVNLSTLSSDLVPEYLQDIPLDPMHGDTAAGYKYCVTDDQESYHIRVHLNDDGNASTTDFCGYQSGDGAADACPSALTDDLCIDRI